MVRPLSSLGWFGKLYTISVGEVKYEIENIRFVDTVDKSCPARFYRGLMDIPDVDIVSGILLQTVDNVASC